MTAAARECAVPVRGAAGPACPPGGRGLPALGAGLLAMLLVSAGAMAQEAAEMSVIARLAPRSLLLDVARAGERLVSVGERGHVLLSDDAGASWRQVQVPARATLAAVHFSDARIGWAVGHDAVILKTIDAGESWRRVHYAPDEERPLLDVWFHDAEHGAAFGAYGYFLRSDDGGETWEDTPFVEDEDFHLNRLAAADGDTLFVAAEAGAIYRSLDRGASWEALPSPYEGSFFGALALPGEVLVFGLRGHLFRSQDDGESFEQVEVDSVAMLTDAARLADGRVVIVGLEGTVLLGRGERFETLRLGERAGLSAVLPLDGTRVLVAGEGGVRRVELEALRDAPADPSQ